MWVCSHLFVSDILERVRHDGDAHVNQIGGGHFEDLLAELLAVFVNFLSNKTRTVNSTVTRKKYIRDVKTPAMKNVETT